MSEPDTGTPVSCGKECDTFKPQNFTKEQQNAMRDAVLDSGVTPTKFADEKMEVIMSHDLDTVTIHPCLPPIENFYGYGTKEMMDDIIITAAKTQREKALSEAIACVQKALEGRETTLAIHVCGNILSQLQQLKNKS